MGPIVFADPAALARLNAIVWPEIARMARDKADSLWKVLPSISVEELEFKFKPGRETSGCY